MCGDLPWTSARPGCAAWRDVIVLDVGMPIHERVDRRAALKQILPGQTDLSYMNQDPDSPRSLSAGATGYLVKTSPLQNSSWINEALAGKIVYHASDDQGHGGIHSFKIQAAGRLATN